MTVEIDDPLFREAVSALDRGDVKSLVALMDDHPRLVVDRVPLTNNVGYFANPMLLWFVAENPIRNGSLPDNIVEVAGSIIAAARRLKLSTLHDEITQTLMLVATGAVPRECEVQTALIAILVREGGDPDRAIIGALAHRERAAALALVEHGAAVSAPVAAGLGLVDALSGLIEDADTDSRRQSLALAAANGNADAIPILASVGVDLDASNPDGIHAHSTALHEAVNFRSLPTVMALVESGARTDQRDAMFDGTPLGWAKHLGHDEIAAYLSRLSE